MFLFLGPFFPFGHFLLELGRGGPNLIGCVGWKPFSSLTQFNKRGGDKKFRLSPVRWFQKMGLLVCQCRPGGDSLQGVPIFSTFPGGPQNKTGIVEKKKTRLKTNWGGCGGDRRRGAGGPSGRYMARNVGFGMGAPPGKGAKRSIWLISRGPPM